MLPIKGLQKTSLIDYPPYTSSVVFIGGCNFRCGYCQNHDLVLNPKDLPTIDEKQICDFLEDRKDWVDAVVITGGEPTLYPELIDFIRSLKKMNLRIKLDTNGTNPDLLWDMLEEKLLDYVAMDIKSPLDMYDYITLVPIDHEKIKRSISLLINSDVDYEFRTTVLPSMLKKNDIMRIGELINGAKRFYLQQFCPSQGVLDKALNVNETYSKKQLEELKKIVEPYVEKVEIRM